MLESFKGAVLQSSKVERRDVKKRKSSRMEDDELDSPWGQLPALEFYTMAICPGATIGSARECVTSYASLRDSLRASFWNPL